MIWYRIGMNGLMVVLGAIVLIRALPLGAGLTGVLVGGGLIGLGMYRVRALLDLKRRGR